MGHPVRAAVDSREDLVVTFISGFLAGNHYRMSLIVESFVPRLPDERLGQQKLAVGPVQHVEETVPVRLQQQLPVAAANSPYRPTPIARSELAAIGSSGSIFLSPSPSAQAWLIPVAAESKAVWAL